MEDRTSIVIAHRLTTVEKCDRIVILDNGKIVEQGTMRDLRNNKDGYFSHLAESMQKRDAA